ncbi:MAG TPA: hypothetical protein VGM98_19225, partial [Schlesneria sp.]
MEKLVGVRAMWRLMAVLALVSGASCNSGAPGSGPNASTIAQANATNELNSAVAKAGASDAKSKKSKKRLGVPEDTVAVDVFPVDLTGYYQLRAEHFEKV